MDQVQATVGQSSMGYRPSLPNDLLSNHTDWTRGVDYSSLQDYSLPNSRRPSLAETTSQVATSSPYRQYDVHPPYEEPMKEKPSSKAIHPYLQLPSTITTSKGSLAEFAAQVTCLFWFESSSTLCQIEGFSSAQLLANGLVPEAQPSTGYLKWVTTILSTTQVTQNVILLALLFIYRLKQANPSVKGKPGSEFRLLTVALMLGNKFLDDNTYTNKTWAEVSGISVQEIHVMEVEFLSHMKYDLYTSAENWQQWHRQLGTFHMYFDRAAHIQRSITHRPSALHIPLNLPSPPSSNAASSPYGPQLSPMASSFSNGLPLLPQMATSHLSPAVSIPDMETRLSHRKRSWDGANQEPPPKRHMTHRSQQPISQSTPLGMAPSLPLPNSSLPMPMNHPAQYLPSTHMGAATLNKAASVSLPPFTWSQPGAPQPALQPMAVQNLMNISEPTSRHQTPVAPMSRNQSPAYPTYPSTGSHTMVPSRNSPSYFLTQRTSPYKPVRGISTLLAAPSSGQMQQAEAPLSHDQMQWQPIGKLTHQPRTGRVPYLHRDAWPQTHQIDQWGTPMYPMPMNG
ncbi:MAG: hypothetical protein M1828_005251 [Chrysothrix sp. TS-e1954]|nr:MAG: hypothetical protein M1828_005251 [Chrysothrix sp. TS-e1954]